MSQELRKKIHLIYGIVLSVLILTVGILLVLSCIDIYRSGNRPFSPESIAERFNAIRIPVCICVALILGGPVLSVALPLGAPKTHAVRDEEASLARMKHRVPSKIDSREPRLRFILRTVTAVLISLSAILVLVYLVNPANFGIQDLNGHVKAAFLRILIATAISFALAILCSFLCRQSVRRETASYKESLRNSSADDTESHEKAPSRPERLSAFLKEKERVTVFVLRCTVLIVAVLFTVLGILNGGIDDVLGKAIRICTECIGLG